jgi:hypothetical protein
MTKALIRTAAVAVALSSLAPMSGALARDRDPDGVETAMIAESLLAQGFTEWRKVKFDDGVWEVDDARGLDGEKYDVKLDRYFQVIDIDG